MEGETNCDASSSGSASELCSAQSLLKDEDECSYTFGSASNLQFRKVTSKGRWIGRLGMTEVLERKGQIWTTTGIVRDGKLYCLIDETLYLMEIGALSLIDETDLPLSLEQMYKKLARENGGYCWECFEAYRHLKSLGYIVGHHDIPWHLKSVKTNAGDVGDQERNKLGEISSEQLVIEEFGDLFLDDPVPDFDVYHPNGRFRKSSPRDPNFLLCIVRGRPPSKLEIEALERKNGSIPLRFCQAHDIIDAGPELCNRKIADIVEENRVYRAQRGYDPPQIKAKVSKLAGLEINTSHEDYSHIPGTLNAETDFASCDEACFITWLGSLPCAVNFAKSILSKGKTLLVCFKNGEDISICGCLAILMSLYNGEGTFDDLISFRDKNITKLDLRRRLVFICSFASNDRERNMIRSRNLRGFGLSDECPERRDDGSESVRSMRTMQAL